jgi:hypothetical protein
MRIDAGRLAGQLASAYAAAQDAAASHRAAAASMRETASGLGSGALQGAAYSALGARLSAEEAELAGAMADYAEFLASCLDLHASALSRNLPEGGCFDTAQIEEDIRALNRNIAALDYAYSQPSLLDLGTAQCDYRWPLRESVRVLEDRLARAYAYAAQSANVYSALPEVAAIVGEGIARAGGMAYANGRFYSPGGFGDGWRGRLGDAILRETEARFLHGGEYDWDAIGAALARPAGEISAIEYSVLARLLAKMDLDDTARFVQRLAERVGEIPASLYDPEASIRWRFDSTKLDILSSFLLSEYGTQLPEMAGAGELGVEQQRDYCMKLALLASLPLLGSGSGLGVGIHSALGSDLPPITLSEGSNPGDVVLGYKSGYVSPDPFVPNIQKRWDYTLTLTEADQTGETVAGLSDRLNERLVSGLGSITSDAASMGLGALAFVPGPAGYAAGLSGLALTGGTSCARIDLMREASKDLKDISDMSGAYGRLGINVVAAYGTEFGSSGGLYVFEGAQTAARLEFFNDLVAGKGISHSLGSPITFEAVLADPTEARRLLKATNFDYAFGNPNYPSQAG